MRKGDTVWLPNRKCKGIVIHNCAPRTYVIQTDEQGTHRQNCIPFPLPSVEKTVKPNTNTINLANDPKWPVVAIPIEQYPTSQHPENNQVTQTRCGCISKPPEHYTR